MKKLLLVVALCLPVVATQLPTGTISGQVFSREGSPAVGVRVSAMAVPGAGAQGSTATGLVGISMTTARAAIAWRIFRRVVTTLWRVL